MVKNPPANAGDVFNFWSGEIPHAFEELNSCAKMREREKKRHLECPESNTDTDVCGSSISDQAPWICGREMAVTLRKNLETGHHNRVNLNQNRAPSTPCTGLTPSQNFAPPALPLLGPPGRTSLLLQAAAPALFPHLFSPWGPLPAGPEDTQPPSEWTEPCIFPEPKHWPVLRRTNV